MEPSFQPCHLDIFLLWNGYSCLLVLHFLVCFFLLIYRISLNKQVKIFWWFYILFPKINYPFLLNGVFWWTEVFHFNVVIGYSFPVVSAFCAVFKESSASLEIFSYGNLPGVLVSYSPSEACLSLYLVLVYGMKLDWPLLTDMVILGLTHSIHHPIIIIKCPHICKCASVPLIFLFLCFLHWGWTPQSCVC